MTAATRPGAEPSPGRPPELGPAIRTALGHLADLTAPSPAVLDGRLDQMLRAAVVAYSGGATPGASASRDGHRLAMEEVAVAVRTACAHLAARELEDAYLALRAAADRMPRTTG